MSPSSIRVIGLTPGENCLPSAITTSCAPSDRAWWREICGPRFGIASNDAIGRHAVGRCGCHDDQPSDTVWLGGDLPLGTSGGLTPTTCGGHCSAYRSASLIWPAGQSVSF